jgi:DNA repair exonuclease SbcCD ATPase subunit
MITPLLLEWDNMFSYGERNRLVLNENRVTQILGVNGNGKSSIPLILEEVVFNKNSKGIKKGSIPNRYIGKGYWVRLTFDKDGDRYVIEVDRKTNIKVKFSKNDVDLSSHTATETFKSIERVWGLDQKTSSQLIYQNPHNSLQFLTATDTNRKKFLIELLQLEEYVQLFELFKEAVKDHGAVVSSIEAQIGTVERWLSQNRLEDTEPLVAKAVDVDVYAEEKRHAELSSELGNIKKNNSKISKNNHYRNLLKQVDIEAIQSIEVEEPRSYDEEQSELGGLRAQLKAHEAHYNKLAKLGDVCPTCEQSIDPHSKKKMLGEEERTVKSLSFKVLEIEQLIEKIKKNNHEHKEKEDAIKNWEELLRSVDSSLPSEPIHKEDLEAELSNLSIRISNARQKLKEITEHNEKVASHNSRIQVILEQSAKFEKELKERNEELEIERDHLSTLDLLKKSFSTNGLVAYKIENLVKDLEDLTNDYLAELSDGRFTIDFSVVSDKLNVNITDNGYTIDIGELSTGELGRVNTATLLALRKLMSSISKSKISILFLDEVMSVLDDSGKEKLVEILLEEDLYTYVVSHGWTHPLLNKLEIVKENNISRIEPS